MSHTDKNLEQLENCASNFNGQDFAHFIKSLKHIYLNHNGLEAAFAKNQESDSMQNSISEFKKCFEIPHYQRTQKHVSDPLNNSAAKRLMYLRWMVRHDNIGVDLGIWDTIPASTLSCR
jgi:uncharacterized protein (TIGR02757 family)